MLKKLITKIFGWKTHNSAGAPGAPANDLESLYAQLESESEQLVRAEILAYQREQEGRR